LKSSEEFVFVAVSYRSFRSRRAFLRASAALGVSYGLGGRVLDAGQLHVAQTMGSHPPAPPRIPLLNPFDLAPFVDALPIPETARPEHVGVAGQPLRYRIRMREIEVTMHRDMKPTRVWSYGDAAVGATIEARSGVPLEVEWVNELPQRHFLPIDHTLCGCGPGVPDVRAVVHVHGGRTAAKDDGYPADWYVPGQSRVLHYANGQDATTLWYHDHTMGINRLNIYAGLMGFYLIRDAREDALGLPRGEHAIPLVLYDRNFTKDGQLYYPISWDPKKPWVPEVFGDAIVVNGKVRPYLEVQPRQYRFRMLNAANGRFFRLSFSHGRTVVPFVQIGSDQGLLAAPVEHTQPLTLAPAERADVLVDFSGMRGQTVHLLNSAFEIVEFRVGNGAAEKPKALPAVLSTIDRLPEASAVATRQITLHEYDDDYARSMVMLLNRKRWNDPVTEQAKLGSTEIWEFVNLTEDTHPMHLHLVRFQILDRRPIDVFEFLLNKKTKFTGPAQAPAAHELGWKDTAQCSPEMITRLLVKFEGYRGRYLYHCHILEHGANEMMRPYDVIA
jgi:spore coat protein A